MCGIGFWYNKKQIINSSKFDQFMEVIRHRGPDFQGKHVISDHQVVANNRLAIIDARTRSNQPFHFQEYIISFNGAIYNFQEIKDELIEQGHVFMTDSDTELIIHAFHEYGEKCVEMFNGMWAIIIINTKTNIVFCSRDRFGIKPIYYWHDGHELYIGSELNQFKYIDKSLKVSSRAVQYYLESGGFKNHDDTTFIEDVFQIEPGCNIIFDLDNESKELRRYYKLREHKTSEKHSIMDTIDLAVERRLLADMKPGMMFSGGLDSSIILAHLLRRDPTINSYSFVDEKDKSLDESHFIAAFLVKFPHINNQVSFPEEFDVLLNQCVQLQGEPPASLSAVAQFIVYSLARQKGEKLMLSGQGADELFAGYNRNLSLLSPWQFLTRPLAAAHYFNDNIELIKKQFEKHDEDESVFEDSVFVFPKIDSVQDYMRYLISKNGLRDLLHYEDRNSMANSIEARVPFLDHELVELAYSLPNRIKLKNLKRKGILLSLYSRIVPSKILSRKTKMAFESPEKRLFESGYLDIKKEYETLKANFPTLKWNANFDVSHKRNIQLNWQIKFVNIFCQQWVNR